MKLIITRHGQTKENVAGIIQGKEHGNVNELGFRQIQDLIKALKKYNISRIISSDIPRCRITSKIIQKEINVPVEYTLLLREKDNGDWVGKGPDEINWGSLEGNFETRKPQNGESLLEVRERGIKFFEDICAKYSSSDETILIVSHGAFLKVFIGNLLGMSLYDSIFKLFIEHCSITLLRFDSQYKEGYRLNCINSTSHLCN